MTNKHDCAAAIERKRGKGWMVSGRRQTGDLVTCPTCRQKWRHVCGEDDGCAWHRFGVPRRKKKQRGGRRENQPGRPPTFIDPVTISLQVERTEREWIERLAAAAKPVRSLNAETRRLLVRALKAGL